MTIVAEATILEVAADGGPTTLHIAGDVEPVLLGTCFWAPQSPGEVGSIRVVEMPLSGVSFGLGSAAFGQPPGEAVRHLGEYVLVDGDSWWTPAAAEAPSRCEGSRAPVLTPFLVGWDQMATARAVLRSPVPVPIVEWYEYLMRRLTALGQCDTGAMAVQVVADVLAGQVVDKRLMRAPLRHDRPKNHKLLTDESNLDTYFLRNAVTRAFGRDTRCTVVMVGLVIDPTVAEARWGADFVRRGFYQTPGMTASASVVHHTHALVATRPPGPGLGNPGRDPFAEVATELSARAEAVLATHIENDTAVGEAIAHVGVVTAVTVA